MTWREIGRLTSALLGFALVGCASLKPANQTATGQIDSAEAKVWLVVALDNTGIEDFKIRNPRRPKVMTAPSSEPDVPANSGAREEQKKRLVRFFNRTLDRTYIVNLKLDKTKLFSDQADPCFQRKDEEKPACFTEGYKKDLEFTAKDGTVTVTGRIDPRSYVDVDAWLLSKAPKDIIPFDVDFFDQTDDPSFSQGFLALKPIDPSDVSQQPDDKLLANLIVGFTEVVEPCVGDPGTCTGLVDVSKPYDGATKKHLVTRGQVDLSQALGNRASAKVSLLFKKADLGQGEQQVTASQYQLNVFGTNGAILTGGRFAFAQPSNEIAVSETGDGVRLATSFRAISGSLSYLLKRESGGKADGPNKDSDAWLLQATTPLNGWGIFRKIDFLFLRGRDRCNPTSDVAQDGKAGHCPLDAGDLTKPLGFPHTYKTFGTELYFNIPYGSGTINKTPEPMTGSLAVYHSEKTSRQKDDNPLHRDGEGDVALLTLGRPFNFVQDPDSAKKVKPLNVITGLIGYGSGDKAKTASDESYAGESTGFSRDLIFLTGIAKSISTQGQGTIGPGLANKWYFGLQYTNSAFSPQRWLHRLFQGDPKDIVAQSSTISLHSYRFHEPVFDRLNPGSEIDLDFRMEAPKSVKWRLSGGYFMRGGALESVLKKDVWSVSAGVILEPGRLF